MLMVKFIVRKFIYDEIMKRIGIILFIFCLICTPAISDEVQDLQKVYKSLLPDFQKLTPEASSLGQYGKIGTSTYTGGANISIPLFSIGSGNFLMSAELSYDASGIKVDQQATSVGLGWNLLVGGSITHMLCGQNDFFEDTYSANPSSISNLDLFRIIWPNVDYTSYPLICFPKVEFPNIPVQGTAFPIDADRKKYNLLRDVSIGARVPDIYHASFCGHNISFTIDSERKARIIRHDAASYDIRLHFQGSFLQEIEITDDHGIIYLFSELPGQLNEGTVSYNLQEIRNPAGILLASFKYFEDRYNVLSPYYETLGLRDTSYHKPIASDAINKQFIERNYPKNLEYEIKQYYLDSIITDKEIVTISYSNRTDIIGAKKIDDIVIRTNDSERQLKHSISFNYGKFSESKSESEFFSKYRYNVLYSFERLKLSNVIIDDKKYYFLYNEESELPSRLTLQQDFWGYYNGQKNTDGLCASPEFKYDNNGKLTGHEAVGTANRYANEELCKIGTLSRITYPTGGYSTFDYEVHHFDDINGHYYYPSAPSATSKIRNIRTEICSSGFTGTGYQSVADSIEFDVNEPSQVTITSNSPYYTSSQKYYRLCLEVIGKDSLGQTIFYRSYQKYNDQKDFKELCELPKGHYVLTSQLKDVASGLVTGGSIMVSFPAKYTEDLSFADNSGKSIGGGLRIKAIEDYDNDGHFIGYTGYKYQGGKLLIPTLKKELIYFKYLFALMSAEPSLYTIPQDFDCQFFFVTSKPTYPDVCSLGMPNVGYSSVTIEKYDNNRQLISYDVEKYHNEGHTEYGDDMFFNLFRVNMDGLNGKLSESATYSNNNELVHRVLYTYCTFGNNPPLTKMVFYPWTRCLDCNPGSTNLDVYFKYSVYPIYPVTVLPKSQTQQSYLDGELIKKSTKTFQYNKNIFQPISITDSLSIKENVSQTYTTKYWYPEDTEVATCNTSGLLNAHVLNEKVKSVALRNEHYIVGGYRNVYEYLNNGLPVIAENISIYPNGTERSELTITHHDEYGNIKGYIRNDGIPVTIIWSYNHQCPVLEIIGRTYDQVKDACNAINELERGFPIINSASDQIRNIYDHLKANMPDAIITAFEYSPWLTLSRMIKPNGYSVDYKYDQYGRLISSSDNSGIIQRIYYNFKTNN